MPFFPQRARGSGNCRYRRAHWLDLPVQGVLVSAADKRLFLDEKVACRGWVRRGRFEQNYTDLRQLPLLLEADRFDDRLPTGEVQAFAVIEIFCDSRTKCNLHGLPLAWMAFGFQGKRRFWVDGQTRSNLIPSCLPVTPDVTWDDAVLSPLEAYRAVSMILIDRLRIHRC